MAVPAKQFLAAMRQLAGAVNIVTTRHGARRAGLTATAVCSLNIEPPRLLACVNKGAGAHDDIGASGRFCVNVLGVQHVDLAQRFSGVLGIEGEERFAGGAEWGELATGAPVLAGALAAFDCRVHKAIEAASHTIFIGDVERAAGSDGAPLIYLDGTYRTAGTLTQA
ncbi:MAG: flavin reductase family protein [Alphaproteobacteria bacterium]|nr:flavin reductase family protein [Alphaproteobacteria bacterium]